MCFVKNVFIYCSLVCKDIPVRGKYLKTPLNVIVKGKIFHKALLSRLSLEFLQGSFRLAFT